MLYHQGWWSRGYKADLNRLEMIRTQCCITKAGSHEVTDWKTSRHNVVSYGQLPPFHSAVSSRLTDTRLSCSAKDSRYLATGPYYHGWWLLDTTRLYYQGRLPFDSSAVLPRLVATRLHGCITRICSHHATRLYYQCW